MGDVNGEPSMEEILSSIKRIIAEEGDTPGRSRRPSRATSAPVDLDSAYFDGNHDDDEILELSDPMPDRTPRPPKSPVLSAADTPPEPRHAAPQMTPQMTSPKPAPSAKPQPATDAAAEPIVSRHTAAATRAPLEALTRMMVKPETGNDGTLEGLVREMLRPMLREWIDANLPNMVEDMVSREIAKIMNQQP
ncbi:hypothetical protein ASE69_07085 [Sphingomonas sp. Leaf208]|uniref:DUF2497 domain-containing protein n=1 Tax=Sphingomonas sp. Leaf208 TaxID=1735679 RepID=UPI0006FE9F24|nr:DUF2497 domain-containing protein [Sphingomonas sp. Leaf208]KQM51406.1 hypothetical protein ASE69_07085 [Sphingomonas sp. Leaf208]